MRKWFVITVLSWVVIASISFAGNNNNLRKIYSLPPGQWPAPFVDKYVSWQELGALPPGPLQFYADSLKHLIELGKILFFDPRMSGSSKISCSTCHQPALSWTDGRDKSVGHEGQVNKRNSPSLQNVWFYKKLFWDGRSHSLEDQAFAPINSESEMRGDMRELPRNLRKIKGYALLFDSAYGDPAIDPDRIAGAIAAFEKTIMSRKTRFDEFVSGNKNALTNTELRGFHLFRTKARCINCHNGPLFTDNQFHNNGFAEADPGLYNVTHNEADRGKFKTPSLRDVMMTKPWMHNGQVKSMEQVISAYNDGSKADNHDKLIKKLGLSNSERLDLLAFLKAISVPPLEFDQPRLPD